MAGIYVHVPFCRRACHYCDFHFTTNLANVNPLVNAILQELELRKSYLKNETISTVYFGGGTPSLLPLTDIDRIFNQIVALFNLKPDVEFTLEANPEDLDKPKLDGLRTIGVNRLSLGTQSFIDKELQWMNRMHSANQAKLAISEAQNLGFQNISIDLIFGLPNQTARDWQHNLNEAISLEIQHISSYGLTIEEKTVLEKRIRSGEQTPPSEEAAKRFLQMNMERLPQAGFEHYETSNYAQHGFISKHNSNYWLGENYLGIGPSAHSFNQTGRSWNIRSNAAYIKEVGVNGKFTESEQLSKKDRLNEHIMTGLRTKWGVQKDVLNKISADAWKQVLERMESANMQYFELSENSIKLTNSGVLLTDKLTSELFF